VCRLTGWGFPASIGVKCALGSRPVICFTGDGGVYYHLAELETAVRHQIQVVVVVNHNGAYGAERRSEPNPYRRDDSPEADLSWKFGQHNLAQIAKELGCKGVRTERPTDVSSALQSALASGEPTVLCTDRSNRGPTAGLDAARVYPVLMQPLAAGAGTQARLSISRNLRTSGARITRRGMHEHAIRPPQGWLDGMPVIDPLPAAPASRPAPEPGRS
jgi:Thiamine pyrophosphate enzyme, C-terminal TPP binding domain